MLKIGTLSLTSGCILAPMAGISDLPFRLINRSFGCKFAFAEMISARSLVYKSRKTARMMATVASDRPVGVQLLGNDPEIIKAAVETLDDYNFDILDFNAACPVAKVTSRGEGAALLNEPRKLQGLLRIMVKHSRVPVTLKIRAGWDENSLNARDVALYSEDAGVAALTVHGRTRAQGYSGCANYNIIRQVKEALSVPVVASGDALTPQLVKRMFDETGCDGVAIARGALGNPWIFGQTAEFLEKGTTPPGPAVEDLVETMISHLDLCRDFYGEQLGNMIFRKFFLWYTRGIRDVKTLRKRAVRSEATAEMTAIIRGLLSLSQVPEHEEGIAC
ncbi:MAG: tRNA dihydrouridine synthase DusB [Candidatus Sulfobium sp.]